MLIKNIDLMCICVIEPCATITSSENAAGISNESANVNKPTNEPADVIPMETEILAEPTNDDLIQLESATETQNEDPSEITHVNLNEDCSEFDLGEWMGKTMTTEQKSQLLKRCWVPPENYDFKADSSDPKRKFIHIWLQTYAPWLAYSKKLKGALCLYCILFQKNVVRGVLGAFVVNTFNKYKDMHDACKKHATSQWHQASVKAAKGFTDAIPVDVQMLSGHQQLIAENKKIIASIISNVIFCGTTDSPLRGKDANTGKLFRNIVYYVFIS